MTGLELDRARHGRRCVHERIGGDEQAALGVNAKKDRRDQRVPIDRDFEHAFKVASVLDLKPMLIRWTIPGGSCISKKGISEKPMTVSARRLENNKEWRSIGLAGMHDAAVARFKRLGDEAQ